MSAVSVGNPLAEVLASLTTEDFTLERGLKSAISVGSLLSKAPVSVHIRKSTEKGLMYVENVGKLLAIALTLETTKEFTLEKGLLSVGNVESPLAANSTSLST